MDKNTDFKLQFPYDLNEFKIVYRVFTILLNSNLIKTIEYLEQNISIDFDGTGYYLPSIFESKDEQSYFDDGVMFYVTEGDNIYEKKISFSMFYNCLRIATRIFLNSNNITDFNLEKKISSIKAAIEPSTRQND